MDAYRPRLVDRTLAELPGELPAVLIVGPRASGKTTTAQRLARSEVRLDRPAEATAFRADPDAALRGLAEPVLLDEWQAVPEVIGAWPRPARLWGPHRPTPSCTRIETTRPLAATRPALRRTPPPNLSRGTESAADV